jgi:putative salt-induced outer membrane protein YdiY
MDDIIRITPIETDDKIWQRLEGSVSFGFQTEKSSGVTTSNVNADVRYRTQDYLLGLQLNSSVTDQPILETTARQSIQGNYQRFKANRWFTDWFSGWERNDELGIQSRTSVGGALGRYLVQTNTNLFSTTLGVQVARQTFTGATESTTDLEGRLEIRYLRRHLSPETTMTFTSKIFPLLEDLSVVRAETDLIFKREFIADLYFEVSIGHSFQSDPPDGAEKIDYAVTTSLGYSF